MVTTVKRVRFLLDFFEVGQLKYARGVRKPNDPPSWTGLTYPLTHETKSQILTGHAVLEDVEMDAAQHASELAAAIAANDALNARTIHARGRPDPLSHT